MTTSKPSTLLFVVNDLGFFLSHRLNVALAAKDAGYKVAVLSPKSPLENSIRQQGIEHYTFELSRWGQNPYLEIKSILQLYRHYRRIRPDIVHHVTIKPVIYGSIAARLAKVSAVVNAISGLGQVFTATGVVAALRRLIVISLYRLAFSHSKLKAIFQNQQNALQLQHLGIVSASQSIIIPGAGVNTRQFAPTAEPPGVPIVLFAARLLREKGIVNFYLAAKSLKQQGIQARFVISGPIVEGHPDSISISDLDKWCSEEVIEYWGNQSDMAEVFKKINLFCLPSCYGEGVPKVLVEAASAQRAIITTDWPGCNAIVQNNVNGILVQPNQQLQLVDALKTLIEDTNLRHRLAIAGPKVVNENGFDEDSVVKKTLAVYQGFAV